MSAGYHTAAGRRSNGRSLQRRAAALDAAPPGRVLSMRYETLLQEPARALARPQAPRRPRLDANDRAQLAAACAPGQTLMGYD